MYFVDVLGSRERCSSARATLAQVVASVMKVTEEQVRVRRVVTEDTADDLEVWVELSSEEQLYRNGGLIAQRVAEALRPVPSDHNVWVLFRVVPLDRAYLNGEARGRGVASFD